MPSAGACKPRGVPCSMPPSSARNRDAARFGKIVSRLRRERGWTLEDFARKSGMNSQYLGVLERGGNMPTLATILRLAKTFDIDAAELVRQFEQHDD